jgi:glycosyltransferase involved in cell wall biosynthesis
MDSSVKLNKLITIMYLIDTYISTPDKPSTGGAEKQLYLLSSSLNPEKFRSLVVQLSPDNSMPVTTNNISNLELFHFPTRKFYNLAGIRQLGRLSRLAKQYNVDIIHTFFEKSEVMGWLTARLSGIPAWITSRRDLGFKRKKIYNKVFRFSSKDCRRCVANCHAVKDKMTQQGSLPDGKIEVIYNGLDLSIYQKSHNDKVLRKELGVEDDVPLVGMIANFNFEIKGHRCFLEAAKGVMEKVRDVEFLLVGDGPLRNQYKEMAQNIGIKEKVHFLGERPDVPAILSHLAVSVLSSTSEGFSNVILESMAAGRPVIATKIGGSPEIVVDGVTGYLVPPADSSAMAGAITALLQEPDKAKAMGAAGKRLVEEKFSLRAMVESYERLYRALMAEQQQNCNT